MKLKLIFVLDNNSNILTQPTIGNLELNNIEVEVCNKDEYENLKLNFIKPKISVWDSQLIVVQKDNNKEILVENIERLDEKSDWIKVIRELSQNLQNTDSEDGLWRWGQIVSETGGYLCVDCGFIIQLEAGSIFPVCEVCLSGLPNGPATTSVGYWEKV